MVILGLGRDRAIGGNLDEAGRSATATFSIPVFVWAVGHGQDINASTRIEQSHHLHGAIAIVQRYSRLNN